MLLIIDTREQCPLVFTRLPSERGTLYSGDYSIAGFEACFAVERKSLDDLASSVTTGRERFERELHRLRGYHFKRLLVIGNRRTIQSHGYRSNASPGAILASISAFEIRYDIPVVFAATPEEGALLVEGWAYWFVREQVKRTEGLVMPEPLDMRPTECPTPQSAVAKPPLRSFVRPVA